MSRLKNINLKIAIPSLLLVAGVIALIFGWQTYMNSTNQNTTPQPGDPVGDVVILTPAQERYQRAAEIAIQEGESEAQAILDEALDSATTDTERAEVYQQKASISTLNPQAPNVPDALRFAYIAEQTSPTYGSAIIIAELEDYENNNYAAAIEYYRLYLDRLSAEAEALNPGDRQFYENRIVELEALQS